MRFALFLVLTFSVNSVFCAPLKLNYSLFYGYMKTIYKLEVEQVTTAFFLTDTKTGKACFISQADIVVDNKREKIKFTQAGRLLPFFSEQHRKDGAMIEVTLEAGQEDYQCALQVTLMAKNSELESLESAKLSLLSEQLERVLKKNAGMIGKYFLPTFSGLRLELKKPLTADQLQSLDAKIKRAEDGSLLLSNEFISTLKSTQKLDVSLSRITPWITH